jgi:hypothetical protein
MGSRIQDAIDFYFYIEVFVMCFHNNLFNIWADIYNSYSEFDIIT